MIKAVILLGPLVAFLWIPQSGIMDPTFGLEMPIFGFPPRMTPLIAALGAYLTGLAWMIRIYRTSHLEPEMSGWRYRNV
jgi:hypothetical protein